MPLVWALPLASLLCPSQETQQLLASAVAAVLLRQDKVGPRALSVVRTNGPVATLLDAWTVSNLEAQRDPEDGQFHLKHSDSLSKFT